MGRPGGGGYGEHLAYQLIGGYILEGERGVFAGQVGQPGDDLLGLAGGVVDLQHVIIQLLGIGGQLLQHQNGVAHDGGEQIIKLVGDTGGECADGLEPVMVGQLLILAVEGLHGGVLFLEQGQLPLGALVAPSAPSDAPPSPRPAGRSSPDGRSACR